LGPFEGSECGIRGPIPFFRTPIFGWSLTLFRLGNIYLLLAMVAVAVLYSTTEPKVVRNYVIALLLADIGHIATTGYGMGYDKFIDFANYNPTTWGNVGITVRTLS
jgi:hypothetical protein